MMFFSVGYRLEEFVPEMAYYVVVNSLVFNTVVFFSCFLYLQIRPKWSWYHLLFLSPTEVWNSHHQSQSEAAMFMQNEEAMSTFTVASFLFAWLIFALMEWMDRDIDPGMDFGSIGIVALFVCFVVLTTILFLFYHLEFTGCSDFFYGYRTLFPGKRATTTVKDDDDVEDMDWEPLPDKNDDGVQDMDWEHTPDVTFYYQGAGDDCSRSTVKSKSRVTYVVRRASPLYWRHPLLCGEEFRACAKIASPGRSFVSAGRALPTIPEGVHFFNELVSETHIVPRNRLHEIARGRRIADSEIDSPFWSFLSAGRALICFLTELASTKLRCRRDVQKGVAQGPGSAILPVASSCKPVVSIDHTNEVVCSCCDDCQEKKYKSCRVHFSLDLVTATIIVPRDRINQIARGRHISVPVVHFATDIVSATYIVPRDRTNQIARGRQIHDMKIKSRIAFVVRRSNPMYWHLPILLHEEYRVASKIRSPGHSYLRLGRSLQTIHEGVHFLKGNVSKKYIFPRNDSSEECLLDDVNDMDWDSGPDAVPEDVDEPVSTTTTEEFEIDPIGRDTDGVSVSVNTTSPVSSTHFATHDCTTESGKKLNDSAAVLVPPLRRSKRLAELQQRREQSKSCGQVELLGSIFVNGRRRSARHVKKAA